MLKLAGEHIEGQMADHIAQLDAHTKNLFEQVAVSQYLAPLPTENDSTSSTITANTIYSGLFPVLRNMTLDRILVEVVTAAADKSCRLGIYNANAGLTPGTLVLDAGTVSVATTGIKAITLNQALKKGYYFLSVVSDGTPTLMRPVAGWSPLGMFSSSLSLFYDGYYASLAYGTLPATHPAATINYTNNFVYYRVATND